MNDEHELQSPQNSPIRVAEFSRGNCPFSNREHSWQQFHKFRNQILDVLASYGTVGPMGKMPILDSYEESENEWKLSNRKPDFFVVDDDMYGMSVRVEAVHSLTKPVLLEELVMLLETVSRMVRLSRSGEGRIVGISRPNITGRPIIYWVQLRGRYLRKVRWS